MVQKMCILPVRCVRCNAVFDLWYDLNEHIGTKKELSREEQLQNINQFLCWNCRKESLAEKEEEFATTYELEIDLE